MNRAMINRQAEDLIREGVLGKTGDLKERRDLMSTRKSEQQTQTTKQ